MENRDANTLLLFIFDHVPLSKVIWTIPILRKQRQFCSKLTDLKHAAQMFMCLEV